MCVACFIFVFWQKLGTTNAMKGVESHWHIAIVTNFLYLKINVKELVEKKPCKRNPNISRSLTGSVIARSVIKFGHFFIISGTWLVSDQVT